MHRSRIASVVGGLALIPSLAFAQSATPAATPAATPIASSPAIVATYTLPDVPLDYYQNEVLPDYPIADAHNFLLGGVGSDLWHQPGDPADVFYMVTDRGPNGSVTVGDEDRTTFPVADFTPTILKVQVSGTEIQVLEATPIVGQSGAPVTGVSNVEGRDEAPYDFLGEVALDYNPSGLDTEGLIRTANGDFWLAEEYSPSIIHVSAEGEVIARYTPEGITLEGADYPVIDSLPAIYGDRRGNRGFEGLTISGDETTLYAALQSPLYVPDSAAGKASVNTRILAFDIATEAPVAEYVYQFDDINEFDASAEGKTDLMKLSAIVWVDENTLILDERTDPVAKLYTVDLTNATNILGGEYDDVTTSPSLEETNDLSGTDIVPLEKSLLLDLNTLGEMPLKIEGVAIIDEDTIAVVNDNDFDINEPDENGDNIPTGKQSEIIVIDIPGGI